MIDFTVPGRPVPAVRMTQRSKWVNPQAQRYLEYKEMVGWVARQRVEKMLEGKVIAKFSFYLKPHGRVPDLSNLIKAAEDALNGIAWVDDRQVVGVEAWRYVSKEEPERLEVEIKPHKEAS